jgi:hypothetical protein
MNEWEYKLARPVITDDHRRSQRLSHVIERVFQPVFDGKKVETQAAVAGLSAEQRGVALSLALDVLEALAARNPGLAGQVEGLWGDYLYAGWPDYDVILVPRHRHPGTDRQGEM